MDDVSAIRLTVDRYGLAVDSQQWDLFDEIFTPDVEAIFGGGSRIWNDRSALKADFAAYHAPFDATLHAMGALIHEIEGNEAYTVTYATWLLAKRGAEGGDVFRASGWYDDHLVRTDRGWLIRKRRTNVVHAEGNLALVLGDAERSGLLSGMAAVADKIPLFDARRRRLAQSE